MKEKIIWLKMWRFWNIFVILGFFIIFLLSIPIQYNIFLILITFLVSLLTVGTYWFNRKLCYDIAIVDLSMTFILNIIYSFSGGSIAQILNSLITALFTGIVVYFMYKERIKIYPHVKKKNKK